jgi:proteic killer suppression protein
MVQDNDTREFGSDQATRLRNILTALLIADTVQALRGPPGWRLHQLTGDRAGTWSISVSGKWRLTFKVVDGALHDVDLEHYH